MQELSLDWPLLVWIGDSARCVPTMPTQPRSGIHLRHSARDHNAKAIERGRGMIDAANTYDAMK